MLHRALLVLTLTCPVLAQGAPPDPSCAAAAVKQERGEADKLLKAGDAKGALAKLDALAKRCADGLDAQIKLWLQSDMTFAAHKAGDAKRCLEIFEGVDDEQAARYPKVAKALLYNAGLCAPKDGCDYKLDHDEPVCRMQLAIEYSKRNDLDGFASAPCKIAGHGDAVEIAPGRCIEAAGFEQKGEEPDIEITCASLYVVEDTGKGKPARHKLALGKEGWITDPSNCCGVRKLGVRTRKGATQILISSGGLTRDCYGGTATTDLMSLFELRGTSLEGVDDFSITWH